VLSPRRLWMGVCAILFLFGASLIERRASPAHGEGNAALVPHLGASSRQQPGDSPSALATLIEAGYLSELRWPEIGDLRSQLTSLYEPTGYALAWIRDGRPTRQALEAIEAFRGAVDKGLNAEDYDGPRWADRVARLGQSNHGQPWVDPIRFDLAVSVSLIRLVSDLHFGRVSPRYLPPGFDPGPAHADLAQVLRERFVDAPDVGAAIESIEPPFPGYRLAQKALVRYIRLAREDDGERLPVPRAPIERGDHYSGVPRLVRLLSLVGDLPVRDRPPARSTVYDGRLVDAVKRFQRRHGLDADGRLGQSTLEQLNTPLSRRVEQLQLSLERWRWIPREPARPIILVNLPEFRLRAWEDDGRVVLTMKVVVGKAYQNETPIVAAEMTQLIFRPSWSVPAYIQSSELVPKVRRDREYLARNGYQVIDRSGKVVASGTVGDDTLKGLRAGGLSIRQTPGAHNSLGLIKFVFPNRFDVYLHGTPAKDLLSRSRRDFSHGCIRVADPAALAAWVLRGNPEWNRERIRSAMRGRGTIPVAVNAPALVVVFYATAAVPEAGQAQFFPDLYGLDVALQRVLDAGRPYPGIQF
jgi:L,D-transpeptidase YcbB